MRIVAEEMRKGPWTEQEDVQLAFYANLFGDRRWDFLSKISGLKRSGKSCRLRWVNYLHPGLKRGKMTPHEERLILELHSKWGNRWSRIARRLPGRTDNEIKNYWRTQMRKQAHDEKKKEKKQRGSSLSPSPSLSNYSSSSSSSPGSESMPSVKTNERDFYDTGGFEEASVRRCADDGEKMSGVKVYSMDEIWKAIESAEDQDSLRNPVYPGDELNMGSPEWDHCPDSVWMMDYDYQDYQSKMVIPPVSDLFYCFDNQDLHTLS